jgi:hypothetical protein
MVAFAMREKDAAVLVRDAASTAEAAERFHLFLRLYGITEPEDVMTFGDLCGLVLACVKLPNEQAQEEESL